MGYRYPQAGWIVLHIEGEPYERGYQHGRLLARRSPPTSRASPPSRVPKRPPKAGRLTRTLVNALFLRRFDREYLEEMKGIADGAAAAGAKFDGRPLDLIDIVAINCWTEIEYSRRRPAKPRPTGLEGVRSSARAAASDARAKPMATTAPPSPPPARPRPTARSSSATSPCSASMPRTSSTSGSTSSRRKGHRVLMQTYPGGIQSGMDYYLNDAGLLVTETTIAQTRSTPTAWRWPAASARRCNTPTASTTAVEILTKANNGLYTNEWLIGDTKTNEIAMFELGTAQEQALAQQQERVVRRHGGLLLGLQQRQGLASALETIPARERSAGRTWSGTLGPR